MTIKFFSAVTFMLIANTCFAQVKIGANADSVNPAVILELSNDVSASPGTWKGFLPAQVDFSNNTFTSIHIWGIAGTPTVGTIVYNIGERYTNGFTGPGLYCWNHNIWAPIALNVVDMIRQSLSTSVAAYDSAIVNNWVKVTEAEYNNLLTVISGAATYATPETIMNTPTTAGWSDLFTVGGSQSAIQIPPSNYIIAWSVRTGTIPTTSTNNKLKVSASQTSGYADYGSPLPNTGTISPNTRMYFVLKKPYMITPASPSYTAVYTPTVHFLGTQGGSGLVHWNFGDSSNLSMSFVSEIYSQVIGTALRQW